MVSFKTREIPIGEWSGKLSEISAGVAGEPIRIWVDARGLGHRVVAGPLPLIGMSYLEKGTEANAIEVTLGEKDDVSTHFTHMVHRPVRLYLQETDDGAPKCLWIESEGADVDETLVCFNLSLEPAPGVRRLAFVGSRRPNIQRG